MTCPDPVRDERRFWSPIESFEHLFKIRPERGPPVPLRLWSHQQILAAAVLRCYAENKWLAHVKSRGVGSSTFFVGVMTQLACFVPGTRVGVIAHQRLAAKKLVRIAMRMHASIPAHLRPVKAKGPKTRLELPRLDSGIEWAGAKDDEPFRGDSIQGLLATEISSWSAVAGPDAWTSVLSAVRGDGFVIAESTPKHHGDELNLLWDDAHVPGSRWIPIFVPWTKVEMYSKPPPPGWKPRPAIESYAHRWGLTPAQAFWMQTVGLEKTRTLEKFRAEYPIDQDDCWIQTGDAVYDVDRLVTMRKAIDGGTNLSVASKDLEKYVPPKKDHRYVIFCDPASGFARRDLFGIEVLDVDACEQVAEYLGHKEAHGIARILAELHKEYNGARIYVEATGVGEGMLTALVGMGLREALFHRKVTETRRAPGWYATMKAKAEAVGAAQELVSDGSVKLHSVRLIRQLLAWRGEDKQRDSERGHFDLASAFAGAAWAWRHESRQRRRVAPTSEAGLTLDWTSILARMDGAAAKSNSPFGSHR